MNTIIVDDSEVDKAQVGVEVTVFGNPPPLRRQLWNGSSTQFWLIFFVTGVCETREFTAGLYKSELDRKHQPNSFRC